MKAAYDLAAFYWPAYHDEPRWRRFFPQGEGEWATIRQAQPKFPGHWQPRIPAWGYESESDPRVMARKLAAAADHGVNVFIFDWYWYEDQPFLEDALNLGYLPAVKDDDRVKFYLMWANHDASTLWNLDESHEHKVVWPGAVDRASFTRATDRVIARYLGHPNYYRIDGKPVFAIYELSTLIDGLGGLAATAEALADFRARAVAAGLPGLHLQGILWGRIPETLSMVPGDRQPTQANTVAALGLDSLTNYQWCHYVRPQGDYRAWAEAAIARWQPWADQFAVPFFPHVSVGWDTNPRFRAPKQHVVTGTHPEAFGDYLRQAMRHVDANRLQPPLITINAWNEWSEGSYLEPDERFGLGYLETIQAVLSGG